ncbi:MAG TPA: amidase [Saprospirales bacterium]|nr:amidase [Saprospirales bacterium]
MNRRKFLQSTALAGAALSLTPLSSCENNPAPAPNPSSSAAPGKFDLNETTIADLQKQMASGERTARQIAQLYLDRIQAIDKNGPAINAVIELNPDALAQADALDRERTAGQLRGPLHGIPVLIKDNIDTGDKMMTTAGSLALEGHRAAQDAFVVKQLRAAGALILGKTNLSEWANFRSTHSSSGWSSRGGQTKNPVVLSRNPSGSSSGSGAAVAANLCAVAVGTETDGSVIAPASVCGVVGLKPTVGLVSRSGIIPISASQDTAGPMARTVTDAAILLSGMTGADPNDTATAASAGKASSDYTTYLDKNALAGKRIGVEKAHFEGHVDAVKVYKDALEALKKAGATLVEIELLKQISPLNDAEFELMQYEFKDGLNRYLASANAGVKSLAEVIAFNLANDARVMPFFKQEILELSEKKGPLTDPKYLELQKKTYATRGIIDDLLKKEKLDALVGITMGPAHLTDLVYGDYYPSHGFYFGQAPAMAGYPSLTVPMGRVQELPVGLSFVGTAWQDGQILGLGFAYEQATKWRTAPAFEE